MGLDSLKWWQTAVFYQIYPRSFADGNGDGIGDLHGIRQKLDHLQSLGVDALWLSPHYPSPQVDCGYDVADYTGVAPEYGDLDTFRNLLEEVHARGMRLILDLVLNHTSDQHPWFQESRSSLDNPKRDWYVWRKGNGGQPPNGWYSTFGGPAWELDPRTGEYYYHFFFKEQPDLNWHNPEVRAALWQAVRFWLDMGVDGFRLDAIGTIFEDPALPESNCPFTLDEMYRRSRLARTAEERLAVQKDWVELFRPQVDQPGMEDLLRELRRVVNEYDDRVLVGESDEIRYCREDMLHLVFNFPLMKIDRLTPAWVLENQRQRLGELPPTAWPCNTLGNHDVPRVYPHFDDGQHGPALARQSLALMLTLRGTPFLYNGEEIGMGDYFIQDPSQFRDPLSLRYYALEQSLLGHTPAEALRYAAENGRDRARTPLAWSHAPNGGFCPAEVTPWLPVNPEYARGVNVADQAADEGSLLSFYRRMLAFRRAHPALIAGDYQPLESGSPDVLAFVRQGEGERLLVAFNMGLEAACVNLSALGEAAEGLFSTQSPRRPAALDRLDALGLAPLEVYIARV